MRFFPALAPSHITSYSCGLENIRLKHCPINHRSPASIPHWYPYCTELSPTLWEAGEHVPIPSLFLIEPDREFAGCLIKIFEAEGFDVHWSESIEQALSNLVGTSPVAAVIDLHDGTSIRLDSLSSFTSRTGNIPILVTAHFQTPEIACKALSIGADDYLLKPFGTSEILDRVRKLTGTHTASDSDNKSETMAASIKHQSDINDIYRICLDQLAGTLHLTDCLIALATDDGYRVVAGRGYKPSPIGRYVSLLPGTADALLSHSTDNLGDLTDGVKHVVNSLGLGGHRPFPILMPLPLPDSDRAELLGFIMGHGALVLDEKDILEIERFLAQVATEIVPLMAHGIEEVTEPVYDINERLVIPETNRLQAVRRILDEVHAYMPDDRELFWIRLALDEAISNAVIHGHLEELNDIRHDVLLRYSIGPKRIVLVVEDSGEGFDHRNLPDPTAEENLLNINGRGIYIMKSVMDEVIYNDIGNCVSLVKNLDGDPVGPITRGRDPFDS